MRNSGTTRTIVDSADPCRRFARGEEPDALMLRFLRARKWDVQRAFMMMAGACKVRRLPGNHAHTCSGDSSETCSRSRRRERRASARRTASGCSASAALGAYLTAHRYDIGKSYTHGTDEAHRPVIYIHVAKHKPKGASGAVDECSLGQTSRKKRSSASSSSRTRGTAVESAYGPGWRRPSRS